MPSHESFRPQKISNRLKLLARKKSIRKTIGAPFELSFNITKNLVSTNRRNASPCVPAKPHSPSIKRCNSISKSSRSKVTNIPAINKKINQLELDGMRLKLKKVRKNMNRHNKSVIVDDDFACVPLLVRNGPFISNPKRYF